MRRTLIAFKSGETITRVNRAVSNKKILKDNSRTIGKLVPRIEMNDRVDLGDGWRTLFFLAKICLVAASSPRGRALCPLTKVHN